MKDPSANAKKANASQRAKGIARRTNALDALAAAVAASAEEMAEAAVRAAAQGDSRALALVLDRVYGKVADKLETTQAMGELSLEEIQSMRARLLQEHPELTHERPKLVANG